jgi:GntR family transcriptional regulator
MIVVRAPNQVETAFFRLPDDGRVSVVETRRTTFDSHGKPVRLTVSVYPADRNQFAVNVGKVPADIVAPPVDEESGPDSADGAADN